MPEFLHQRRVWAATWAAESGGIPRARNSRKTVVPRFHCLSCTSLQPVTDPLVKAVEHAGRIGEPEILLPAPEVAPQFRDDPIHGSSTVPGGDLPDTFLHRCKGLRRDAPLHLPSRGHPETVAQELPIPRSRHRALRLVDPEPEPRIEPPQRLHHVLACPPGPHVHVAVVGVAHEGVPALLQLLVHLVEEHVRQQRRKGAALRRPLVPLHHHPVRHDAGLEVAADESQHPLVRDPSRQLPHQHVVVDPVEELLQVHVHHHRRPSWMYRCASHTASCALRPGRKPWLCSENVGSNLG